MPSYAITTFGCQMNVHDSQRMDEVLRGAGFAERRAERGRHRRPQHVQRAGEGRAEAAERGGEAGQAEAARKELVLVVAGCVAQQEGEKLIKRMRAIDLVVGPDNIPELPRLLEELSLGGPPAARTVFDTESPRFLTALSVAGAPTAFVTTMKGCDERCSFCIVPHTRGPERYRAEPGDRGRNRGARRRGRARGDAARPDGEQLQGPGSGALARSGSVEPKIPTRASSPRSSGASRPCRPSRGCGTRARTRGTSRPR
jgi:hypothetical protein